LQFSDNSDDDNNFESTLINDLSIMEHDLDDDADSIWEDLNKRLHQKFGYAEEIKRAAVNDDLKWARTTLPAYINWERMKSAHLMLEFWQRKVLSHLKKSSITNKISEINEVEANKEDEDSADEVDEVDKADVNEMDETDPVTNPKKKAGKY
jgi:hypothetical protein